MDEYKKLRSDLRKKISSDLSLKPVQDPQILQALIEDEVNLRLLGMHVDLRSRKNLIKDLFHALHGLDILQPLIEDNSITEIMVNGPEKIFIERQGRIERCDLAFDNAQHLSDVLQHFFALGNKNLNLTHPIADLRLADGSRANAVLAPLSPDGPTLTIRKFSGVRPKADALLETRFLSTSALELLRDAVVKRESIFICGGTGTGKTTLLNVLSNFIPKTERVISIEDSAELQLQGLDNLVRLESRSPGPEGGGIDIGQLIRTAMRMRPDRIIVGEVRGGEAFDMLTAMNSGHPGTLCTGHANSCADMMRRLSNMVLSSSALPYEAIKENLAASIRFLVHIKRNADGSRQVNEICKVVDESTGKYSLEALPLGFEEATDA